jgi:putative membrane protein
MNHDAEAHYTAARTESSRDNIMLLWLQANFAWLKAFHIIFMVCWFAGIFYLPRLFVHHAVAKDAVTRERLSIMEAKLYRFITPFAWLTVLLGLAMMASNIDFYKTQHWLHAKIALVALLVVYHLLCGRLARQFAAGEIHRGHVYYRIFNELPVLILFAIVILVVVRPF